MQGVVYFLRSASGKIKVGFTTNLTSRLGAYRTNSYEPIELIGCINGDVDREKEIMRDFSDYHIRGEWFDASGHLYQKIHEIIRTQGIEPPKKAIYPDNFTQMASEWVEKATQIISSRENMTFVFCRNKFAEMCGVKKGLIENLTRERITAITATDYEKIRLGYIELIRKEISIIAEEKRQAICARYENKELLK